MVLQRLNTYLCRNYEKEWSIVSIFSDSLFNVEALLSYLESASNCTGLSLKETKTGHMPINNCNSIQIKNPSYNILKCVKDYKYLVSLVLNSENDYNIRKVMAWNTCNKIDKLLTSSLNYRIKI